MIWIVGGFETPFYFVVYTDVVRYGYGLALAMALPFVVCDFATVLVMARSPDAAFLFRSGFLCLKADSIASPLIASRSTVTLRSGLSLVDSGY